MLLEDPPVAGQARQPLLHARARRLDERDHRHARAPGAAQHVDDGLGVRLAQRSTGEGGVLGQAVDLAPGDPRVPGEHPVAGARPVAHPPRANLRAQQLQRPGVDQRGQPLGRGQALLRRLRRSLSRRLAVASILLLLLPLLLN